MNAVPAAARRRRLARTRVATRAALVVGVLLTTAACSSQSSSTAPADQQSAAAQSAQAPFYAELPQAVKDKGEITIAGVLEAPPFVTTADNGELVGLNPATTKRLGELLGIDVTYHGVQDFGSILTGIAAGRFEGGYMFSDTAEREAVAQMISVIETGVAFLSGPDVAALGDAYPCGGTIGVPQGSIADSFVTETTDTQCADGGATSAKIARFANGGDALLALSSGQVDYYAGDPLENANALKKSTTKMTMSDKVWAPRPTGFAMSYKNPELNDVVTRALQAMIDDGSMAKILEEWNAPASLVLEKVKTNVYGQASASS